MDKLLERIAVLETYILGKEGLIERLDHLDKCVDSVKATIWKATGAIGVIVIILQWLLRHL